MLGLAHMQGTTSFAGKRPKLHLQLAMELEPDAGYDTPASKINRHWRDINLGIPRPCQREDCRRKHGIVARAVQTQIKQISRKHNFGLGLRWIDDTVTKFAWETDVGQYLVLLV